MTSRNVWMLIERNQGQFSFKELLIPSYHLIRHFQIGNINPSFDKEIGHELQLHFPN
jgi:hypothetical protein